MLELIKAENSTFYKGKKETFFLVAVEDEDKSLFKKVYTDKEKYTLKCKFIEDILMNYTDKKCSQEEVVDLLLEQ